MVILHCHPPERAFYAGLPDLMTTVASQELKNLENLVSECSVVYFPQVNTIIMQSDTHTHTYQTSHTKCISLIQFGQN